MKRCTHCQRVLELDEFYRDRGTLTSKCRTCKCAQSRQRYWKLGLHQPRNRRVEDEAREAA